MTVISVGKSDNFGTETRIQSSDVVHFICLSQN